MRKGKQKKDQTIDYKIVLCVIVGMLVISIGRGEAIHFGSLPCLYMSDRGLPLSRIDIVPTQMDVSMLSSSHITLYPLDLAGERICHYSSDDAYMALSPDGRHIAFEADMGYPTKILTTSIDGTDVVDVSGGLQYPAHSPVWSPDGEMLVFKYCDIGQEVWVAMPDETHLQQYELNGGVTLFGDNWASWSPDGQQVAITVIEGPGNAGSAGIYIIDTVDAIMMQVTSTSDDALHGAPIWVNDEEISFATGDDWSNATRAYQYDRRCVVNINTHEVTC